MISLGGQRAIEFMTVPAAATSAFYIQFPLENIPNGAAVFALLAQGGHAASIFTVTHQPFDDGDWLELLSSGLTFDLSGLSGNGSVPDVSVRYGVDANVDLAQSGWLRLTPGEHLGGGRTQIPVIRGMAAIALALLDLPGATGVAWGVAQTLMSAEHFRRIIPSWLTGGAFPALGLTALSRDASGAVRSSGLSFFTGLELCIDPLLAKQPGLAGKIAVRLIHSLVGGWKVVEPVEVEGPEGDILGVFPEENGKLLRVCRKR